MGAWGAVDRLREEIARSLNNDHAEAIVLGCAGMVDLAAAVQREFGVPVIDGVSAAVKQAEALVSLGLSTAKRGAYALPVAKPFAGLLSQFVPRSRRLAPALDHCHRDDAPSYFIETAERLREGRVDQTAHGDVIT